MVLVNVAHDELQRAVAQKTSSSSGGRSARASAHWDQHPWLSEVLRCVGSLICAAVLFHVLKLVECNAFFVKDRRRKSASAPQQRWWNMAAALVIGWFASVGSLISMACISVRAPRCKYPMLGNARPGRPYDRVSVYPPDGTALLPRFKSWANDIVPVLLRRAAGKEKRTDPTYRVITFNGEPPGSWAGHFEATRKQD